jgi:RNA polymerase sigma-70 factor, ECF subfamily
MMASRRGSARLRPHLVVAEPESKASDALSGNETDLELLVERAKSGEIAAWGTIYERTLPAVFRHMCFVTKDPALAEDLTQETFAQGLIAIASFDGRCSITTWLRAIGSNLARMRWRKVKHRGRIRDRLRFSASVTRNDPEQRHLQEKRAEVLYSLLEELPSHLREAFVLRDLQGLSIEEGAAICRVTSGNFAVRATRARARIRQALVRLGWLEEEEAKA